MKAWYFSFIFCLLFGKSYSQNSPFVFSHLSEKDGLSYNVVNCFLKDSRGYLWIGTYDGLNRYDGAHFIVFRKTKNSNSLVHNTVLDLCEDKKGNIWGSTDNGIFCYDLSQKKFTNYTSIPGVNSATIANIICDKSGDIWAISTLQLLKLNKNTNQFEIISEIKIPNETKQNNTRYNGMQECPSGKGLWLVTLNGLLFYDFQQRKFLHSAANNQNAFTYSHVSGLSATKYGHFWFMDNSLHQFICFDPISKKIIKKIPVATNQFKGTVATTFEDSKHRLWFCTWQYQLGIINYKNDNEIIPIQNNANDVNSIATEFFWAAMEDDDGNMWIGNMSGISKFSQNNSLYKIHWLSNKLGKFDKYLAINTIVERPTDKSLWITTNSPLVVHYQPITDQIEKIDLSEFEVLKSTTIQNQMRIAFFNNSVVFLSNNGAWVWDEKRKKAKPFKLLAKEYPSFVPREILQKNDSIYYLTNGDILLAFNKKSNKFSTISFENNKLKDGSVPYVNSLTKGKNGMIWAEVATNTFAFLNKKNKLQILYLPLAKDHETIGFYYDMVQENDSILWIVKKIDGLYRYNFLKNKLTIYNETDGLVFDHIMAVALDSSQQVWTVAYNKVSVFMQEKQKFFNFSLPIVNHNYYYINRLIPLSNGNLLTNMKGNLVEFFPKAISAIPKIIDPTISSININGKEILLHNDKQISLKPDENSIVLKFGLMTDKTIFPYIFKYKLDGVDNDWVENEANAEAIYSKLGSGDFVFHLKAEAKNGLWQSKEYIYTISIRTPFYKTWWFYTLLALSTIAAAYAFYRYRLSEQKKFYHLREKAENLEKEKTIVQYESLKQHLNPHFLFNSLTSLRSLIKINPANAVSFLDGMSKVYRYVLKSGEQELTTLEAELDFTKTYIDLQKTRFGDGLMVNIVIEQPSLHKYIAPVTLQNLVENAIKHNTADADSPLIIDIFTENDFIIIKNNLQRYRIVETSNKRGLNNIRSLYKFYSEKEMKIIDDGVNFIIKIPLI